MDDRTDAIPELALAWHRAGRGAVLATVMETWGSAPCRAGSQMVIDRGLTMRGSVSGGCVEAAVAAEAGAALRDGRPRVVAYGVSDEDAMAVGLACGGSVRILIEPVGTALPEALLGELVASRVARRPVAYEVSLATWDRRLIPRGPAAEERFHADLSGVAGGLFIHVHNPPPRMAVVGAVHIAQHLVPMAGACGLNVLVVDPRTAFATSDRFPATALSHDWPDAALADFGLDSRTAVVTLSHDPKLDDPAVAVALRSDVFYLGCLGSRRTHAARRSRLAQAGFAEVDLDRIRAPIGLDIGAASPAEIAVAILADVIAALRRRA